MVGNDDQLYYNYHNWSINVPPGYVRLNADSARTCYFQYNPLRLYSHDSIFKKFFE